MIAEGITRFKKGKSVKFGSNKLLFIVIYYVSETGLNDLCAKMY